METTRIWENDKFKCEIVMDRRLKDNGAPYKGIDGNIVNQFLELSLVGGIWEKSDRVIS